MSLLTITGAIAPMSTAFLNTLVGVTTDISDHFATAGRMADHRDILDVKFFKQFSEIVLLPKERDLIVYCTCPSDKTS